MIRTSRRKFLKYGGAAGAALSLGGWANLARADETLRVGVVYVSPVSDIGWTKQHSLGVEAIRAEFGDRVELTVLDNVYNPQDAERVFRELASNNHLVIGTSFSHGTPMQRVAPRFPDVAFEHCSGIVHLDNLGTFEAKYYEGTYVAGVAAGHMSESGRIGFVGGFPIPDIVGPANALLLGAQSVNPDVTCSTIFLNSWYDPGREREAVNTLVSQGCDVICSMTDTATGVQTSGELGAWSIGYASDMSQFSDKHLTAFTLDWTGNYLDAARTVADGTWVAEEHWGGLAEGVVKMSPYNEAIPAEVQAEMDSVKAAIAAGELHPYRGELRNQDGEVVVAEGEVLSDGDIRSMVWFVEGMIGSLS